MNSFAVLCLLVCCVAVSMAQWPGTSYLPRRHYPQIRYCTDYLGQSVRPGQSYSDGCNICTCGSYGQPTLCTLRFCGGLPSPGLPIRQVRPRAGGY